MTVKELKEALVNVPDDAEVLLCVKNDGVLTARLVCDKSDNTMFWSALRGGVYDLKEPTHWQPIVLPKKEKQ